jgi:hypothetical protein
MNMQENSVKHMQDKRAKDMKRKRKIKETCII